MNEEQAFLLIPEHTRGGVIRYIQDRIEPGGFLMAVLENNLKEAIGRADHINRSALNDIVSYFYNFAPSTCWGSPEKVKAWISGPQDRE